MVGKQRDGAEGLAIAAARGYAAGMPALNQSDVARADRQLFARYAAGRDPAERDALVDHFMPLARSLAARYVRRDEPFEDLLQVAAIGLIKAVEGYDVERGRAFSSYAVPTIAGEIKRYYRDKSWSVRVARDLQDRVMEVTRAADALEGEHQRSPTVREIAERLGIDEEAVLEARTAAHALRPDSLDAPVRGGEDEGRTVGERTGAPDDGYLRVESRAVIGWMMRVLSPRDRLIVRLRYERDLTQEEIGERIGLSQMQVSRVLRQSVARMREGARQAA
jgi:RNA polymerase sigma-B factor